jgi:hypothetical protein
MVEHLESSAIWRRQGRRHQGERFWLAMLAMATLAGCAQVEVVGWVAANQPMVASYTPGSTNQFNSTGNANTVVRSGVGQYSVTFAHLGGTSGGNVPAGQTGVAEGNVQVTAWGSDFVRCQSAGWQTNAGNVTANVSCFQGAVPADSQFLASYMAVSQPDPGLAYTYFDPTVPVDSMGVAHATTARSSSITGVYTPIGQPLFISGFVLSNVAGMEHVTADSAGPSFCNFEIRPRVTCWDPSGAPVTPAFSYVKGFPQGFASTMRGAFAAYDIAPGDVFPTFTPTQQNAFSSNQIVVNRASVGLYTVVIPGAASAGANALVHVTGYDLGGRGAPVYCKPVTWGSAGPDVAIQVSCFLNSGTATPTDDAFYLSYIVPTSASTSATIMPPPQGAPGK